MSPRTGRPKSENPKSNPLHVRLDDKTLKILDDYCERTGKKPFAMGFSDWKVNKNPPRCSILAGRQHEGWCPHLAEDGERKYITTLPGKGQPFCGDFSIHMEKSRKSKGEIL